MGDILHALPAATALRQAHPGWMLGWAVDPRWQALLQATGHREERGSAMPVVDRLHLVNARQWGRQPFRAGTWTAMRGVRRELREARYDVCVDLQGAVRSAMIGRWSGAARLIGEEKPREPAARWFFREKIRTAGRHVIEQAVEVLEKIVPEKLPVVQPVLPRDVEAEDWVASLLKHQLKAPFVLISPGAGWGAKRWPVERYGKVASDLTAQGYGVVVNTGPEEMELGMAVVASSGRLAMTVSPSLGELIALTRRASLLIAGDTGPLHLACALAKPVVGIFGPTDPARNGPFGCNFKVLRHPESKRDHTRHVHPEAGLLTITPEAVLAAAGELLTGGV